MGLCMGGLYARYYGTSVSYATHKKRLYIGGIYNPREDEKYRNYLPKRHLSDDQVHFQTGRRSRPKTPKYKVMTKLSGI